MDPFTIIVEGNLATGKSLFLKQFEKTPTALRDKTVVLHEPLDQWTNLKGFNILDLFNRHHHRYGFALESYAYLTLTKLHTQPLPPNKSVRLMERSIWSANDVFARNLFLCDYMRPAQYEILKEWHKHLTENEIKYKPNYIVHLTAPPEVLLQRIKKRGRAEETRTSLAYLEQIEKLYEKFIDRALANKVQVLQLNTNKALAETKIEFRQFISNMEIKVVEG